MCLAPQGQAEGVLTCCFTNPVDPMAWDCANTKSATAESRAKVKSGSGERGAS